MHRALQGFRDRRTAPQTSSSARWRAPVPPTRKFWPVPRSSALPRPTRRRRQRGRRSGEDGDPRPPRLPHPVTLSEVAYEGIETIQPDDLAYAKELGLSLKLLGVAERRQETDPPSASSLLPLLGPPAGAVEGPFNAVMVEAPAITEVTMSGPRRGRATDRSGGARRRRLDPRRRRPGPRDAGRGCQSSPTSPVPSICTSRSPTGPVSWRRSQRFGDNRSR